MDLKSKILAAVDLPTEAVHVKAWDCTVHVRTMTGKERDAWEVEQFKVSRNAEGAVEVKANEDNVRARLLARVLVDEDGQRIFTDDEAVDLGRKSAAVLEHLYGVAQRLNAISRADIAELAKN